MKHILYYTYIILGYLIYPFLFISFSIVSLLNKATRKGNLGRLGFIYPKESLGESVWIHAVSVGEVLAVKEIVSIMLDRGYKVYLSTTTYTGYDIACKTYKDSVELFYLTLDYPHMIKKLIRLISPEYVLIAEIEIWPTLLRELYNHHIPIYLVNGRIGEKEIKGYKNAKFFFEPYFNMYSKIFAQSETDKKNMILIGMNKNIITVSGNLKYDITYNLIEEKYEAIKNIAPTDRFVIVAGSTHKGEEALILEAIKNAGIKDKVYIVLVPRDIERSSEVKDIAESNGFNLSLFTKRAEYTSEGMIINLIGELLYWYKRSDLVIMGGTLLNNVGGHNILEAIYFKKPVMVGKYMYNFTDMYAYMKDSLINIEDNSNISRLLEDAYREKESIKKLGEMANKLLLENKGATSKTISTIDKLQGIIS